MQKNANMNDWLNTEAPVTTPIEDIKADESGAFMDYDCQAESALSVATHIDLSAGLF